MVQIILISLCISLQYYLTSALTGDQIATYFRGHLSAGSSVYLPNSIGYSENLTQRWDTYITPSYVVGVKPATIEDVQKVVTFAAAHNDVPFLATGGGHGSLVTLNSLKNGIDLDLGNFQNIRVDPKANHLHVGGAVRFANVTKALQAAKKEMRSCSCIGMMGAALGAGLGPYTNLYGLITDQLISAKMVVGSGDILDVSATQNPDLFWAIKGAGHNFGIVTSAVFKIYDATNDGKAVNTDMILPISANGSVWNFFKSLETSQPKELYLNAGIAYNSTSNQSFILVNSIYSGSIAASNKLMKPLLDLLPTNLNIETVPWDTLEEVADYGLVTDGCEPQPETDYNVNLHTINVQTLVNVTNYMNMTYPTNPVLQASLMSLEKYGNYGVSRVDANSTAYPWRDSVAYASFQGFIPTIAKGAQVQSFGESIRQMVQSTSGYPYLSTYINLAHGDEGAASWYSKDNLPKLRTLKNKYDPMNLFRFYGSVFAQA